MCLRCCGLCRLRPLWVLRVMTSCMWGTTSEGGARSHVCLMLCFVQVEAALGVEGDDILYVGDHIYTDAALAKINFRWGCACAELDVRVALL